MAKKKFVEKRRIERTTERETAVDPRDYRNTQSAMLSGMKVQFETHGTGFHTIHHGIKHGMSSRILLAAWNWNWR